MKFIINSQMLYEQLLSLSGFEMSATIDTVSHAFQLPDMDISSVKTPTRLVDFCEARAEKEHYGTVHFFIDDRKFECVWNNPSKYLPLFEQYDSIIGPDYSQHVDMSYDARMYNIYRNKTLTDYMIQQGLNVIYNVSWSLPDTYDYSFSDIPLYSVIAINCTGIWGHYVSRYLWLQGYREALARLKPRQIIRYGDRMPGEAEDISVFFPNERLLRLRQLPKCKKTSRRVMLNQINLFEYGC
jgi:hypothetical protein